jgi:hypothetical protein
LLTASDGKRCVIVTIDIPSSVATRHSQDVALAPWSNGDSDLLARDDEVLLQQVRVVRLGDGDAGVPEDLRQFVDVASRVVDAAAGKSPVCFNRTSSFRVQRRTTIGCVYGTTLRAV